MLVFDDERIEEGDEILRIRIEQMEIDFELKPVFHDNTHIDIDWKRMHYESVKIIPGPNDPVNMEDAEGSLMKLKDFVNDAFEKLLPFVQGKTI